MSTRKNVAILVALSGAFGTAWVFGKAAYRAAPAGRAVKNLAQEGNPDQTVEIARALLSELRANNWNWNAVEEREDLLISPDQYAYQHRPNLQGVRAWTWNTCPQAPYADEVAFFTSLYTWEEFEVIPGIEGKLHVSGFYIVAWKDGRVERVPATDARMYPVETGSWIVVFPGMSEYDAELPVWGSSDISEKTKKFKAKLKAAKDKK
jgi:hypothetical protein